MKKIIRFDSQELFNKKLKEGISFFLGAGFAVEAKDSLGVSLPTGQGLLCELKERFEKVKNFPDLSKASTVLEATYKEEFHKYLEERFRVGKYNPLYKNILKVNVKNIYTTNIDNLLFQVYDESTSVYLNNTAIKGATYAEPSAVNYFPLHGCILNPEKGYIFCKTKIASAYSDYVDDWSNLRNTVSNDAIVFWGWNFEDSDAIEALYSGKNTTNTNSEKWIVLYEPEEYEVEFYKALNFKIIIADTIKMLQYIQEVATLPMDEIKNSNKFFAEYSVPKNNSKIANYPLVSFYEGDVPRWSQVFSGAIPKLHYYDVVIEYINANKNVFVIGIPASGKTTLMMQLASDYNTKKHKHILKAPSKEQIELYLKQIGSEKCILFIDECFRDVTIIQEILQRSNIQLVGFDRDYAYESQAYRLRNISSEYEVCDITEINDYDARRIIDSIPRDIKKSSTSIETKDHTIFSLLVNNSKKSRFEKRFYEMIDEFYATNPVATELFIMICYVHSCGVPVSFDMIFSYLRNVTADYEKIYNIIDEVGNIIRACSEDDSFRFLNVNFAEQDYYQSRSRYFAELIIRNIPNTNNIFKKVLETFVDNVPAYKICRFDIYKRRGYDADYTTRAFVNYKEGENYYLKCAEIDESEYLYQQAALYFARKRKFSLAFEWIEKARNFASFNRFSIDNTHAIIQFNANIAAEDTDGSVIKLLKQSLDILENCYKNDRRKSMHAKTFASLALDFYDREGYDEAIKYIQVAHEWIGKEKESKDCGTKLKQDMRNLYERLSIVINYGI